MKTTQKEISHEFYKRRKDNGLCPKCGKELDREGHYCSECLVNHREYVRENRIFYIEHGLCSRCGKERVFGEETICPECNSKAYISKMRQDKNLVNEKHREWSKRTHHEMIEKGICTRCRKRKADGGLKTCAMCREKKNRRYLEKNFGKLDRSKRADMGICYFCDNTVEIGYKVCEYHHRKNIEYANLDKTKDARNELLKQGILY